MDDTILDALSKLLAPLGDERRNAVLGWMKQETEERAVIAYCWDGAGVFELGKPSPINEKVTIFAMLHWEQRNCVVVFGVEAVEMEDGTTMVQYQRQVVFEPKHIAGPVSGNGLFNELASFMVDDDGGKNEKGNGKDPDADEEEEEE